MWRLVIAATGDMEMENMEKKRRGRKRANAAKSEFTPTGRPRKKKEAPNGETRIVWNEREEELMCEKCGKLILWNFGFKLCPYCRARVTVAEARRAKVKIGLTSATGESARLATGSAGLRVVLQ